MMYNEERDFAKQYKQDYIDGIKAVLEKRVQDAEKERFEYTKNIFENQQHYRTEFKEMLGWPLVGHKDEEMPECSMQKLSDEEGYTVYRASFEILKGLKLTGLFFKMNTDEPLPLVIVQHGGEGTPELISGAYGTTGNYNEILYRVIKHKVHAFAPQLLLWHESYNVEYNRRDIDAGLKRVGSSITAVEVYGITRILDYFEKQSFVSTFGMVGLSYGGFYTLFTSAIDTRIKSAISCSFFNTRDEVRWSDWTWTNAAYKFDDAEVACLVYPRTLHIQMGDKDELFKSAFSEKSFAKIKELCKNVGTGWVSLQVFDGTHEFCKDDAPIEKLVKEIKK